MYLVKHKLRQPSITLIKLIYCLTIHVPIDIYLAHIAIPALIPFTTQNDRSVTAKRDDHDVTRRHECRTNAHESIVGYAESASGQRQMASLIQDLFPVLQAHIRLGICVALKLRIQGQVR